ncbi:hypothetical protein BBJ29_002831, partial [Phytophthora kernoviae]
MMPTTQSQTTVFSHTNNGALGNDSENEAQLSPNKPLANLNVQNPLASIVHQADKNGKQQPVLTSGADRLSRQSS